MRKTKKEKIRQVRKEIRSKKDKKRNINMGKRIQE